MNVSAISFGLFAERVSIATQQPQPQRAPATALSPDESEAKPALGIDISSAHIRGSLSPEPFVVSTGVPVSMLPLQENQRLFLALGEALVRLIGALSSSE